VRRNGGRKNAAFVLGKNTDLNSYVFEKSLRHNTKALFWTTRHTLEIVSEKIKINRINLHMNLEMISPILHHIFFFSFNSYFTSSGRRKLPTGAAHSQVV